MTIESPAHPRHVVEELDRVTIRFAGDSGDGMQLTGTQFTKTTAVFGNDLATLPDYPAEIRAPTGSLPGVSGFQISFASTDIRTPGDQPDALVAMNPAALKTNIGDLRKGGLLIVDEDEFNPANLKKAAYPSNPLEDGSLAGYQVVRIQITRQNELALEGLPLSAQQKFQSRNFYALGLVLWLYGRPLDTTIKWANERFRRNPDVLEANLRALRAGHAFGETTELFHTRFEVPPAPVAPGLYRHISGNEATALGFLAASVLSGLPLFYGSYPITPASDVLHELAKFKHFGVKTFQAEDEIAAITSAIGAAYGGALAITTTSGPGMALKTEAIGLATTVELPLVIVDIQRGGPSTGLPTKTEQADLMQALFGRNSEAPVPVLAASSPGDCFWVALEASRIAIKYMVPVIVLSDGYLANGAEPWRIPDLFELPEIPVRFRTEPEGFRPYARDETTLARPWAVPGTAGLEHRIGGLEKEDGSGNVSYDPLNHERMVRLRAAKVEAIAQDVPDVVPSGDPDGDLLIVGWGSTYGAITAALRAARGRGRRIGHVHLRHLNPLPRNLGDVLKRYRRVLVPELNMGQLLWVLRARYLVDAAGYSKVQGKPFKQAELEARIDEILGKER
jgi:2-oxoglutarate ferredoxin oxidoreductase subunit alpha